jgi:hypothetical protein
LTDEVINYLPEYDFCAGRKEIIQLHTEPFFKVRARVQKTVVRTYVTYDPGTDVMIF